MDVAEIVRSARVVAGLSQREVATAAGISRGSLGDIEAGRRQPSWTVLVLVLDACGLDLALATPHSDLEDRHKAYLRMSTSERLYFSLGGRFHPPTDRQHPTWRQLGELTRRACVSLPPAAALGIWLPTEPAPAPLPVLWHTRAPVPPHDSAVLEVTPTDDPPATHLIPLGVLQGGVRVPTPVALAMRPEVAGHAGLLRAVCRYLHAEEGSDRAWRRRPAHRHSSPALEEQEIRDRHAYGPITDLPSSMDRREWRARSVVSFSQWLAMHRYPDPRRRAV